MGIYGDMLLAWPEQMRTLTVYEMQPELPGGWSEEENPLEIRGIIQHTSGRRLKDLGGNLAQGAGLELWTNAGELVGRFTKLEGDVYRITGDNKWESEGGFFRYTLEKVIGNDNTEQDNTPWNTGANNFG